MSLNISRYAYFPVRPSGGADWKKEEHLAGRTLPCILQCLKEDVSSLALMSYPILWSLKRLLGPVWKLSLSNLRYKGHLFCGFSLFSLAKRLLLNFGIFFIALFLRLCF